MYICSRGVTFAPAAIRLFAAAISSVPVFTAGGFRPFPQLMELRHRDAPVRHRALRIRLRDRSKLLVGLGIAEGVQQRDPALKRRLLARSARDREVHGSESLRARLVVMMVRSHARHSGHLLCRDAAGAHAKQRSYSHATNNVFRHAHQPNPACHSPQ